MNIETEFYRTLPSRMSIDELRRHANNGNSPYYEEARRRIAEYEQSDEYQQAKRLEELPLEELEKEFNERMQPIRKQKSEEQATRNALIFVRDTPEYLATEQNSQNIRAYLGEHKLKPTVANLQYAAAKLAEAGILQLKSTPLPAAPVETDEWGDGVVIDAYSQGDEWL